MTNTILQNDIFIEGRINVFLPDSGDMLGYVTPELKAITLRGANPDFRFSSVQAAVKYILAVTQPKKKEVKQKSKIQINLF